MRIMVSLYAGFLLAALVALLAGCASLFGLPSSAYERMTAEQIKAVVSERSSAIVCGKAVYAGATVVALSVNTDRGIPAGITVKEDCSLVVDTKPAPRAERRVELVAPPLPPAMGIEVSTDCTITATHAPLAEILRLAAEIPACPRP